MLPPTRCRTLPRLLYGRPAQYEEVDRKITAMSMARSACYPSLEPGPASLSSLSFGPRGTQKSALEQSTGQQTHGGTMQNQVSTNRCGQWAPLNTADDSLAPDHPRSHQRDEECLACAVRSRQRQKTLAISASSLQLFPPLSHGLDLDLDRPCIYMERRGAPRDNSLSDWTEMASVRPRLRPQCGHAYHTRPLHSPLKLLPPELSKT
ncbi:hypothetical protein CORC01_01513 [Colletotrichum orchidophilum]|uniref:Uncharacterized protein n=1 Tax=Colletotrichum orchidophilum TaxID=1209926 RepID=A0A1G4BNV1_9PEZI|nr:uncharacterized protein CORC01_01513 [Colletotrichum orchidophilum]OHF03129.1 hypothetical protein CORC01_01513 [Colletotrichum orchidophilum]